MKETTPMIDDEVPPRFRYGPGLEKSFNRRINVGRWGVREGSRQVVGR